MDVKEWSLGGRESFTTPGGPFHPPAGEVGRVYEYSRGGKPRSPAVDQTAGVTPAPRRQSAFGTPAPSPSSGTAAAVLAAEAVSPFAPQAAARARREAPEPVPQPSPAPVVLSHDGESGGTIGVQQSGLSPQGGPVYTIQLPAQPKPPAPRRRSLWWLPFALIAALLLGGLLGLLAAPLLDRGSTSAPSASAPEDESAERRVYRQNAAAVTSVTAIPQPGSSDTAAAPGAGTGFLITADGYLLTNAHVVANAAQILVGLSDGQMLPAKLVGIQQEESDLALLKIDAQQLPCVSIGDSDSLRVGDRVMTIGNPLLELSYSLTTGYLSAGPRRISSGSTTMTMLQTNAAINRGNSGGPLFDAEGKVVGIVTAKYSNLEHESTLEGLGFALPINDVMRLVEPWIETDRAS